MDNQSRFEAAYRALGYEINLTHMGKVSMEDAKSLLRAIYEKRARMNKLIAELEQFVAVENVRG